MSMGKSGKSFYAVILLVLTAVLSACGGGGGGSTQGPPAKATITGAVTFPDITDVVQKSVAKSVTDTGVAIEVYTLDGAKVTSVNPVYDDALATKIYSYSIPELAPGVDYVIKAKRGNQVLKKLIEKKDVVSGAVAAQTVDATSTAAVVIASQKLSSTGATVVLGDPLPAGKTIASLSSIISTEVKPALLEGTITAAVNGGKANLTGVTSNYANILNMVVTAVSENKDPAAVFAGTVTLTTPVPMISVSGNTVTVTSTTVISTTITTLVTSTASAYTAPTESAATYLTQAKMYLNAQDIANASLSYEKALSLEPDNTEANVGGAITTGLMLFDDPDFKTIAAKWGVIYPSVTQVVQGTSPIKLPFGNLTSVTIKPVAKTAAGVPAVNPTTAAKVVTALKGIQAKLPQQKAGFKSVAKELGMVSTTAPTVGEMQALIENVIIPKFDKIAARLAKVEAASGATFTVTKSMQGNPMFGQDVVLSAADFYAVDTALNLVQVLFEIATSYNFDLPSGYTYDTVAQDPLALLNSSTFGTLKSTGSAKMAKALEYAKIAQSKLDSAYKAVLPRTAADTDAGRGIFDLSSFTTKDKADAVQFIADLKGALAGPQSVKIKEKTVTIDLTKFFTAPLTKAKLPTFDYDVPLDKTLSAKYGRAVAAERKITYQSWNGTTYVDATRLEPVDCNVEPTSDLPDYTLNGILPGNTAANNVAEFNGILPMIAKTGKVLTGSYDNYPYNLASDGSLIYYSGTNYNSSPSIGPVIKQIDPATGVVSVYASASTSSYNGTYIQSLVWFNGGLYSLSNGYSVNNVYTNKIAISPINVSGGTLSFGTATPTPAELGGQYSYISAAIGNGTDLYYAVSTWDQLTYTSSYDIRKWSNPLGSQATDVRLFTVSDHVCSLVVSGSNLYVNGDKYNLASPYARVATYANLDHSNTVLIGGYFYRVDNGKIVKFAGTPAGGTAKLLGGFF